MMKDKKGEAKQSSGRNLNWLLAGAIVLLAGSIIATTIYSIDSLQKNSAAVHKIKAVEINPALKPLPDPLLKREIKKREQADEDMQLTQPELARRLEGSEIIFRQACDALESCHYSLGVHLATKVLAMVPDEAKTKKMWIASGDTPADRNLYTAFVLQLRSICYLQQKKMKEGIDDLNKAIKLRPSYAINYRNRAAAYNIIGQRALAQADLNTARQLEVKDQKNQSIDPGQYDGTRF
jgi:tetratricopeptide (TPR) repeat protein